MEYLKEYDVEKYEESLVRAEELGLKEDFEEGKVLIWGKTYYKPDNSLNQYDSEGNLVKAQNIKPIAEFSLRTNIWKYNVSFNDKIVKHPAVFPEQLAEDCILSWSVEGDTVLDPFMGSGTTAKMAMLNNRNFIGFEINEEYYNGILKRLDTFISADKNKTSEIEVIVDGESTNCQVNDKETDKELNEKTILFNNLLEQLNDYFNEQSLSILKTLTLTFKTDANEKRVRQVLEERKKI